MTYGYVSTGLWAKTKIDVRIVFFSPLIIREYIDIIKSTTMLAAL